MILHFACPICDLPSRLDTSYQHEWQCQACDHRLQFLKAAATDSASHGPQTCLVCSNGELYKKKGFPHWLGLSILTGACLAFLVMNGLYHQWWAWLVLLGSAAFDGLLYLRVPDVIVCYRCGTRYSGVAPLPEHQPFELVIGERYRQERLRRELLQATKK
jgi:hypothetical protein